MLTALAMAAALGGAPAQPPAELKFTNVRTTVGELGPTREVTKILPGDILLCFGDHLTLRGLIPPVIRRRRGSGAPPAPATGSGE